MKLKQMKKNLNKVFFVFSIFLLVLITGCSNNSNLNSTNTDCKSTSNLEYKTYMNVPLEKIDYFSNVNIALILDTSGSMEDGDKLIKAKEASKWLVNELDPRINIGLFEFNTNASIIQDFTKSRDILTTAIQNIKSGGSTYFVPVLKLAMMSFVKGQTNRLSNIIIFISDGQPKDSYREILQNVQEITKNKICIYTVQYTTGDEDSTEIKELQKVLKEIAQTSVTNTDCGRLYSDVGGENSLLSVFKDIYTQIKSINYEAFIDIENPIEKFIKNNTIEYRFNIMSVYNLNKIPNYNKCILPVKIIPHIYNSVGEEIHVEINTSYDESKKNYFAKFGNLSSGKYYLTLEISGDEDFIKAYKRIDFEIFDNDEFLQCPYTCEQYQNAIAKSLQIEQLIILNDGRCTMPSENYFSRYANFTFFNTGNKSMYVTYKTKDELKESKVITSGNEYYLRLDKGYTDVTCHNTVDEIIHFSDNNTKKIIAIENTLGMSGNKILHAKRLAKYIVSDVEKISILTFNDESKNLGIDISKENALQKISSITLDGNSNIIKLFNLINTTKLLKINKPEIKIESNNISINGTNETLVDFNITEPKKNVVAELTIISDGIVYSGLTKQSEIENIINYVNQFINQGLCINVISLEDANVFSKIVTNSQEILGCGELTIKNSAELNEVSPKKVSVKDYSIDAFNISTRITYDNVSYTFTDKTNLDIEIFVYENNYSSTDTLFDIICSPDIEVEVQLYRDSSMVYSKKATRITENNFFVSIEDIPKNTYRTVITATIVDKLGRKCDFYGKNEFFVDIADKLIT
ncbi:VWA domain-containing protein [Candidatus Woesearchaeota archaeon]|nr:VWA domain-containing protein [Candidatus Woesearchaeota archaeon]